MSNHYSVRIILVWIHVGNLDEIFLYKLLKYQWNRNYCIDQIRNHSDRCIKLNYSDTPSYSTHSYSFNQTFTSQAQPGLLSPLIFQARSLGRMFTVIF